MSVGQVKVSQALKDNMIELTMNYLLEQPTDLREFANRYFSRMQRSRRTTRVYPGESPTCESPMSISSTDSRSMSFHPIFSGYTLRRKSVCGDSFNPELVKKESWVKPVYAKTDDEKEVLRFLTKSNMLLRVLDHDDMVDVINAMFKRTVKKGDVIIRQGDAGDNFYVIEKGIYDVFIDANGPRPVHVRTYEDNGGFGELALLYNQPRTATVEAASDGVLWALDGKTFRTLVLKSAVEKREMHQELVNNIPLFKNLDSYERLNLADVFVSKTYEDGDIIFQEGDEVDGIYFVEQGEVSLRVKNHRNKEVEVKHVYPGGHFGELCLITKTRRVQTAYAVGHTRVTLLDEDACNRFMGPCMDSFKKEAKYQEKTIRAKMGSGSAMLIIDKVGRRKSVYGENMDPKLLRSESWIKPVFTKTDEENESLRAVCKKVILFRALDEEDLDDVINAMFKRTVRKGDVVIKQGEEGDNFYVIQHGIFDVFITNDEGETVHVRRYEDSGSFGELALLYHQPRAATITAVTDGILWALDRKTFRAIVLLSAYEKRELHLELIEKVPLLESLDPYERMNLADALVVKKFDDGDVIYEEGEPADGMYFVDHGEVSLTIKSHKNKVEVKRITAGGFFGEMSMVIRCKRMLTATAVGYTKVAFLEVYAFERFMGPCMDILRHEVKEHDKVLRAHGDRSALDVYRERSGLFARSRSGIIVRRPSSGSTSSQTGTDLRSQSGSLFVPGQL